MQNSFQKTHNLNVTDLNLKLLFLAFALLFLP